MRAVFELLSHYDSQEGLDGLIQRVDMTDAKQSDIYRMVHQRAPERIDFSKELEDFDPHAAFLNALLSKEFRLNLLKNILASYPEKKRDVYFHVPKCAGTDLTLNLAPRRASLPALIDEIGSNEEALVYVSHLCRSLRLTDNIFIYGHIEFGKYIAQAGVRSGDRFFTVIRDPVELMISQVSDALSQVLRDPEGTSPDSKMFLGWLGLERLPADPSVGFLKALWIQGLLDLRIAQPNRICTHLGHGGAATYAVAMTNIVTYNVEITTVQNYSQWLRERWDLNVSSRHNASERYLFKNEVKRHLLDRIWPSVVEDEKFYRVIQWALLKSGKTSITGHEIYKLAGNALLDDLPEQLMNKSPFDALGPGSQNCVAVQGRPQIERLLAPFPPELIHGAHDCFLSVDLGASGNGAEFTGTGWARVEPEFTWTDAVEATLKLPRPENPSELLFQAQIAPFIHNTLLPAQSIEILVNGTNVAGGVVTRPAVLECQVPWSLISAGSSFDVTFRLPNATRPVDIGLNKDQRLLGIAVRWVKLFCLDR